MSTPERRQLAYRHHLYVLGGLFALHLLLGDRGVQESLLDFLLRRMPGGCPHADEYQAFLLHLLRHRLYLTVTLALAWGAWSLASGRGTGERLLWFFAGHGWWSFLYAGWERLHFPFALGRHESLVFRHILRVIAGEPLYPALNVDFVPLIYTPFYYYACAAAGQVLPVDITLGRWVNGLATLTTALLLLWWVGRRAGRLSGLAASGLYLQGMYWFRGWFVYGRNDCLGIMLMLAGTLCLAARPSHARALAGAVFLFLGVYTKQSFLFWAAGVWIGALLQDRRRSVIGLLVFLLLGLGVFGLENRASAGWFFFYTVTVPAAHWIVPSKTLIILFQELGEKHFWLWGALVLYVLGRRNQTAETAEENLPWRFWLPTLGGVVVTAALSSWKVGGWVNDLIPVYLIGCLLLFSLGPILRRRWGDGLVAALFLAAFLQYQYLVPEIIPKKRDHVTNLKALTALAQYRNERVLFDADEYWADLLEMRHHANHVALSELWFLVPREEEHRFLQALHGQNFRYLFSTEQRAEFWEKFYYLETVREIDTFADFEDQPSDLLYRLRPRSQPVYHKIEIP
jgi:hypothetical protein